MLWVHDYHLIPLGQELRAAEFGGSLGFFLHIPFPPYDVLRTLPGYAQLLWDFAAYDLVGFQTANDCANFLECVRRGTEAQVDANGRIRWGRRHSRAAVFPIGIDVEQVRTLVAEGGDSRSVRRLRQSLLERPLVIGVDRLDYSKGLPERFRAYGHLLARYRNVGRVIYLQVAPSRRICATEYHRCAAARRIAGEIDGRHAEFD